MSEVADLHVLVRGRVQGVGFRFSVVSYAASRGLEGWVRNRSDGSVEVVARGSRDAIDGLRAFLDVGPRGAQVERVEQQPPESVIGPGFDVRY